MRYIVEFVTIILTVAQVGSAQDIQKCMDLIQVSTWKCCAPISTKSLSSNSISEASFKECIKLPTDNCERDICFGIKRGYITSDGKFDKKTTQEKFIDEFSSVITSETMDKIVNNCINGDLTIFGPPDMCNFRKFGICVSLHMIITCSDWNTTDSCTDIKNLADECSELFA